MNTDKQMSDEELEKMQRWLDATANQLRNVLYFRPTYREEVRILAETWATIFNYEYGNRFSYTKFFEKVGLTTCNNPIGNFDVVH